MKWRLLRDEFYASQFQYRPISKVAEEIFGSLDKLDADWKQWLAKQRTTFQHIDWGWEQNGNAIWAYGFPWDPKLWSQMNIRYAPNEKVEYNPLRMDYPAEPMPPIVGPVKRGVEEPSVGYVIANVGGCWGGFGLGVEGRSLCQVVIAGNRLLVIDGNSFGITRKEIPLTPEVNAAAAKDFGRYGVTIQIRKKSLEVAVRAGKPDAVKEMKASVPIDETQRERLIGRPMSMIGRNGYPAITPWIDDARKLPPDLTKPAPANRWRYAALDPLFTLYKAAYLLKDETPKSLLALKAELLAAADQDEAGHLVATVARTLHTYTNTVKILCDAFRIEFESSAFKCERRLIEQAFSLNHAGKSLTTILDDAHLMDLANLRKLRLLFEDFPKNHNLVLIGRPSLLANLDLGVNHDIKSRVTYSVISKRLGPDLMRDFLLRELDRAGLGHNTFTQPAVDLIVRSADGVLRQARNLCVGCLIEAIRAANKTIDIDNVNRVLMQPHWQKEADLVDF